jgi:cytochrome P450
MDSQSAVSNAVQPKRAAPVTKGLPLVGSVFSLASDPFRYLLDARERYGDIYTLDLGVMKVVVLNHPSQAQRVFVDNMQAYRKGGGFWDTVRSLLGNGLPVSEGDFWMRQRRMMQPHFHRQKLAGLTTLMVAAIDEALSSWESAVGQQAPFNLSPAFSAMTMKVVCRALFGSGLTPDETTDVQQALVVALDYILQGIVQAALPSWMPAPGRRRHLQAVQTIDRVVYRVIADCRAGKNENTLLSMLLGARDEAGGEQMTDLQVRDEVASMFLAGYETTSLALTWACAYLMRQPELLQRLRAEVDGVLGTRTPTFEDLPKLTFTRQLVQETMRLRSSVWQLMRTVVKDDTIDGVHLTAGTQVMIMIHAIHQHPEIWPDPTKFDPERFTPDAVSQRHKYAWLPFGAGQRVCIGRDFALMEAQLALAMLTQRYGLRCLDEGEHQPRLSTTLQPKGGVNVALTRR